MKLLIFAVFLQLWIQVELTNDTLVLVHLIARHGERMPDKRELHKSYPYYEESKLAPFGYGQLTNVGKSRMYNLGKTIRSTYNGFLDASYHYTLIEARSTFTSRTKESLQLLLAGLFPPTEELTWSEDLKWLPIATYYDKDTEDKILYPWGTQTHKQEMAKFRKTKEYQAILAPYKDFVGNISKKLGSQLSLDSLTFLVRGLQLAEALNLTLPDWHEGVYPNPLKSILPIYLESTIGTKTLKRICGGYLLKKIVEDTEKKINGDLNLVNRKMFIYLAHDVTMSVLLSVLDLWNRIVPSFGSYFAVEVHYINCTYGFKFFMFNDSSTEPQLVTLPGHGEFVTLKDFKIKKREYLQLDDIDKSSSSTRLGTAIECCTFIVLIVMQLSLYY